MRFILLLLLYWLICCGFYYLMALAFVGIMGHLVRIPKGWFRNALWLFFFTPARIVVVLFPFFLALELFYIPLNPQKKDVDVLVMVILLFFISLIPAWRHVSRHRQFIVDVIRR